MDTDLVTELLERQSGVVARHQFLGRDDHAGEIQRRLRRREWVRLLPGVFLDHTGEPTWMQRAWAGVLACWPSALTHESSLRATNGPGWSGRSDDLPILLAVERDRRLRTPPGYQLRRVGGLDQRVQWNLGPPRTTFDDAVIDVAAGKTGELAAIETLAEACRARRTTPARLLKTLSRRPRIRNRHLLESVLGDVSAGACSVLEQAYLDRVERSHRLPSGRRQVAATTSAGGILRDVEYEAFGLVVELDGRLHHGSARQRDRDLDRDLDAAVDGRRTVRLGWGQVFDRSCHTAQRVGALLAMRGWAGGAISCGGACPL
jgi:hypothetical protein